MSDYIDLELSSPWLNASGSLGFVPGADGWPWLEMQGGFVTNPISLSPRSRELMVFLLTFWQRLR